MELVRMPLAPQYWVGGAENIKLNIGTNVWRGFWISFRAIIARMTTHRLQI